MLPALFSSFPLFAAVALAAQVRIGDVTIVGKDVSSFNQEFYGGIPFAEPPLGELRLAPPVLKLQPDGASYDASQFKQGCIQPLTDKATNVSAYSEDCLHLSIVRPAGLPSDANLPVMVWFFGGGFHNGDVSTFNASNLVKQGVDRGTPIIYVTMNYRLGPLGFPMGAEAEAQGILNLGLKDQISALQWVQANIGSFGGDKTKVTVFGSSAGSISIAIHMLRPDFTLLARAAIMTSGSVGTSIPQYASVARKQSDWASFVASVPSCSQLAPVANSSSVDTGTLECLRGAHLNDTEWMEAVTASENTGETVGFGPAFDSGDHAVFNTLASTGLAAGNWSKLPFIAGTNLDEGTFFIGNPDLAFSNMQLAYALHEFFTPSLVPAPGLAQELDLDSAIAGVLALYSHDPADGSPYNTGNETFGLEPGYKRAASILGDLNFQAQRRMWSSMAASQGVKSYAYQFSDPQPESVVAPRFGVTHSTFVPYQFGNCAGRSETSQALCVATVDYMIAFAATLDPNDGKGTERPAWDEYSNSQPSFLTLNGTKTAMVADTYRENQINFVIKNSLVFHQ